MKTFTYKGNKVTIDGIMHEVTTTLPSTIFAVQYHEKVGKFFEETDEGLIEVPRKKYQSFIQEWTALEAKRLSNKEKEPTVKEQKRIAKYETLARMTVTYGAFTFPANNEGKLTITTRIACLSNDSDKIGLLDENDIERKLTKPELKEILYNIVIQENSIAKL